MLIHNTIPVTLFDNLLTFRDTNYKFELKGDLLKMITKKNYNVDHASLLDKKLMDEFAKEMYVKEKAPGKKSAQDRSLESLIQSLGFLVFIVSKNNIFVVRS